MSGCDPCSCEKCEADLCPGDVLCGSCGEPCDPDTTRGFRIRRPFDRGDTIEIEYDLVDRDGAPIDATAPGVKVWFTLKDYLTRPDVHALWQGMVGSGISQLSIGKIRVSIPPSATSNITEGITRLYYDVQIKDGAARIATVEKGIFEISPDVTRAIS